MAELILSDVEKAALLWTDLDDQALGALLRKKIVVLQTAASQMDMSFATAAALLLVGTAGETNSNSLQVSLESVTQGGRDLGDWDVTVTKKETAHGYHGYYGY
jgi:hypothetical protein